MVAWGWGRGLAAMDTGNLEEDENILDLDCGAGYRTTCLCPNSETYTPAKGTVTEHGLHRDEDDFTERPGLSSSPACGRCHASRGSPAHYASLPSSRLSSYLKTTCGRYVYV